MTAEDWPSNITPDHAVLPDDTGDPRARFSTVETIVPSPIVGAVEPLPSSDAPADDPPRKGLLLEQLLKREGWVGTGGQAKFVIQEGMVRVNGAVETRRRKQLAVGDVVEFETFRFLVTDIR